MGCCSCCYTGIVKLIKCILVLFNLLFVVCGIILIAVGAIILVDENKGPDRFTSFSIGGFAIAVGVFIFLVAFFGCCGAIKENSCMLTTYAIILILLFILQIVLGALAFVAVKNDDDTLTKDVRKVISKFFQQYDHSKDDKKLIDEFQKDLKCCGVDGPEYWTGMSPFPKSCCKSGVDVCSVATARAKSCTKAFKDLISDNIEIIAGVAIGFGVLELIGAIFACLVRNRQSRTFV